MTPLEFAKTLAWSDNADDRVLAVAMVARGLTDDDPATGRQGWPLTAGTVGRAAEHLGLPVEGWLVTKALALAPTLSDALLNKHEGIVR